jgi:hypothetical protein
MAHRIHSLRIKLAQAIDTGQPRCRFLRHYVADKWYRWITDILPQYIHRRPNRSLGLSDIRSSTYGPIMLTNPSFDPTKRQGEIRPGFWAGSGPTQRLPLVRGTFTLSRQKLLPPQGPEGMAYRLLNLSGYTWLMFSRLGFGEASHVYSRK